MRATPLTGFTMMIVAAVGHAETLPLNVAAGDGERGHSFYMGFGYGPTQFKADGNQRQVSGIDFTFDAKADDLGGMAYAGYWISDHLGLEIGGRDFGQIDAPFSFSDPHDGTAGTGESVVSMGGFNISLMLGFDILEDLQVVLRAGALSWKENFDSRFDVPGEPPMNREMETSGTGATYGIGMVYRFTPGWQVEARFEQASLDEDEISLVTIGFSYDFVSWIP